MNNAEILYLRLPESQHEPVLWLVWNHAQDALIASGELANAQPDTLQTLLAHAQDRELIAYVPTQALHTKAVALPATSFKQLGKVVPYALEDELAEDIDELHFAWPRNPKKSQPLDVHVVSHELMQQWLLWLNQAGLTAAAMYADLYAVPLHQQVQPSVTPTVADVATKEASQAVVANTETPQQTWYCAQLTPHDTVKFRTGMHTGFAIDRELAQDIASQLPAALINLSQEIELPLTLLAHTPANIEATTTPEKLNLLQGRYQTKKKKSVKTYKWRPVAIAASIAAIIGLGLQIGTIVQLNQQAADVQSSIERTYREAFPNETRIVNVRAQLNQHLRNIQAGPAQESLLTLMAQLQPAFQNQPQVKLELLRYENGELRIQAKADTFEQLEEFQARAQQQGLNVSTGQANRRGEQVSGSFTISAGETTAASTANRQQNQSRSARG